MLTSQSPWKVMRIAHELASVVLPDHASKFSRHDFTLAQLFACLAVREQLNLSYRKLEGLLADTDWCRQLGMKGVPDHSSASGRYRRQMQRQLQGSQAGRPYGQRSQAETVMSMLKRNLGDSLRARSTERRKMELMLKVITHNLMIVRHRRRVATEPSRPLR
jgi:hypothetical protein